MVYELDAGRPAGCRRPQPQERRYSSTGRTVTQMRSAGRFAASGSRIDGPVTSPSIPRQVISRGRLTNSLQLRPVGGDFAEQVNISLCKGTQWSAAVVAALAMRVATATATTPAHTPLWEAPWSDMEQAARTIRQRVMMMCWRRVHHTSCNLSLQAPKEGGLNSCSSSHAITLLCRRREKRKRPLQIC